MNESTCDMTQLVEQLQDEAAQYRLEVSGEKAELMVRHLMLVIEKNRVMNLTRIVDEKDAITKHVVDSLLFARVVDGADAPDGAFVDIGTGAGFPGIPFAIMSNVPGVLLDSVAKKIGAVTEFIHELGLESALEAQPARVEEFARNHRESYAVVMARAVAELNVLVEYAAPLLVRNGVLVVSKGRITDEELVDGDYAAKLCGMRRVSRETLELPHEAGHRELITYRKVRKPSLKLPRSVGVAKHKPLTNH